MNTYSEAVRWLADTTSVDPSSLAQYGIAGTVAALAICGLVYMYRRNNATQDRERDRWLVELADTKARADAQVAEERARSDRLEGELARLNTMVQTQVLTALNEATRAVSDAIATVRSSR